jgi:transposase
VIIPTRLLVVSGAKLIFLPNYSTILNPIQQAFAILRHLQRNVAARTVEGVRRNRRNPRSI